MFHHIAYMHACMHAYIHTHIHTDIDIHTHIHTDIGIASMFHHIAIRIATFVCLFRHCYKKNKDLLPSPILSPTDPMHYALGQLAALTPAT